MRNWLIIILLVLPEVMAAQGITLFAGGGMTLGDNIPATTAYIPDPAAGVFDREGNYFVVSLGGGQKVRKIDVNGIISLVAGTGIAGYNGDNIPATSAQLKAPCAVALDTAGNLYICEGEGARIRKIDKVTGIITTFAGNGILSYSGDGGAATSASLNNPMDICFDKFFNLYIADYANYRIRKISSTGIITTIAGNGNIGYSGDGARADTSMIGGITGLCADSMGNLYLGDNISSRIFKINTSGYLSTVGGTSTGYLYNGDDIAATTANISPNKIIIDDSGYLLIGEVNNWRVRKIDAAGIIHTIAGNGINASTGDGGPATSASIAKPNGLAFDACGNLYIPEANSGKIRKVTFNPITTPSISIAATSTVPLGSTATVNATVSGVNGSYNVKWYNRDTYFATTTGPVLTYTKAAGTDTITAWVLPAAVYCYDSALAGAITIAAGPAVVNGINNLAAKVVSIYPNPGHTEINIMVDGGIEQVSIINLMGQALLRQHYAHTANAVLEISTLPTGIYVVKVNDTYVQRLLKE